MKINNVIAFCVSALMVLSGCNKYDDSILWDGIDKSYNQLTEIKAQLEELTSQVEMEEPNIMKKILYVLYTKAK